MQLNRLLFISTIICFFACDSTQTRYEHAIALLDPTQKLNIENLDEFNEMTSMWPRFTFEQAEDLRTRFQEYQLALAEDAAGNLEYQLDSLTLIGEENTQITDSIINSYAYYTNYGINVFMCEGEASADITPMYEVKVFEYYLSDCEKALTKVFQCEIDTPSVIDEAIAIDYTTINNRLAYCDKLDDKYNDDPLHPVIEIKRQEYLSLLMYGTDNTPAFDWHNQTIKPEAVKAIKSYIKKHPRLKSTATLKTYLSLLEENKGKRNDKIDIFISSTFPAN